MYKVTASLGKETMYFFSRNKAIEYNYQAGVCKVEEISFFQWLIERKKAKAIKKWNRVVQGYADNIV